MTEEVMAANDGMETPVESAPTEETTVEETTNESELDTNTVDESAEEDVNVPLHENPRFKEVYHNMKAYKEENEQLKAQLSQGQAPVEEEVPNYIPQQPSPSEIPNWVLNQDGEIIPEKFIQFTREQAVKDALNAISTKETESKVWNDTYEAYPQLKENPELKQIVENAAYAEFARTGKAVHPKAVAEKIFGVVSKAKQEGASIAQANAKVIDSAYLESNSPAQRERTLTNADLSRMSPEEIIAAKENGSLDRALAAGTLKGERIVR